MDCLMQDSLLIRALHRQAVERTPVWLMRQAGRYLPEYRKTRAEAGSFWTLCQTPELACEVTLQPLRRYDLDASIVFSDILTIPQALGMPLDFLEKQGPVFGQVIRCLSDVEALKSEDALERLSYVFDTVSLVRANLPTHVPLFGFSGSPWTLACYMIEGRGSREFENVFNMLYRQPEVLKALINKLTPVVSDYLIAQAKAGAQALMIFDTWGGILPAFAFMQYDLSAMREIVQRVKLACPEIPLVIFSKGAGFWLSDLADLGCHGLGLDWTVDLGKARAWVGNRVSLQGNLHPKILLQDANVIRQQVKELILSYGKAPGHIFNLGHGITPDVHPDAVSVLIEAVREYSVKKI
jgi:uroporphyrinogen decarboxylase